MSLIAPKGRQHLSADALFRLVRSGFDSIPDHRGADAEIAFTDALMSACAMFALHSPSLLAFDKRVLPISALDLSYLIRYIRYLHRTPGDVSSLRWSPPCFDASNCFNVSRK